jgi:amino acid transporter
MNATSDPVVSDSARLSPWDGVSIIIGIVVGVSIFESPRIIFSNVSGPVSALAVWVLGGVLSLIGALCYAELTTTYPQSGGDYAYLKRAYGNWVGFLFGWAQLVAILTGSIGAMAYVFANYGGRLFGLPADSSHAWLAASVVGTLAIANLFGVVVGKSVQNLLTLLKLFGVFCIIVAGLVFGGDSSLAPAAVQGPGFGLAMILVLYAYGGWNDAAFVAAEVRDRQRNLPRVLLIGTGSITVIYLLVNAGYLWALGFEGARNSQAPAADVLRQALGPLGERAMSVLVMISALGAVNGMLYTGSRVYASLGADHRVFAFLGRWNPYLRTPIWSIIVPALIAVAMICGVGTAGGRDVLDRALQTIGLSPLPWDQYGAGFETLVAGTAPVFWLFFLLTGLSLFVLRSKDRDVARPFRVPLFPVTPVIFCLTSVYMLYSSLIYARQLALIGIIPLIIGLPLYWISRSDSASGTDATQHPSQGT